MTDKEAFDQRHDFGLLPSPKEGKEDELQRGSSRLFFSSTCSCSPLSDDAIFGQSSYRSGPVAAEQNNILVLPPPSFAD